MFTFASLLVAFRSPTLPSFQLAPASQVCKAVSMATCGEPLILDIPEVSFSVGTLKKKKKIPPHLCLKVGG